MILGTWFSGEDAYKKIRAGATLIQLYTAFAYGGPALIPRIKVSFEHLNQYMMVEVTCLASRV